MEANVGWCGWIPAGWQASKFRCPRAEERGRVTEFAGGRRQGRRRWNPKVGRIGTTIPPGNPMSAGGEAGWQKAKGSKEGMAVRLTRGGRRGRWLGRSSKATLEEPTQDAAKGVQGCCKGILV